MTPLDALARLEAELGRAVVTTGAELQDARRDKSGWVAPGRPLAVVNATEVTHVQTALRIAHEFGIAVVPRGAGTGLAGGAAGTDGALVVSVASMNRILEVNAEDEFAVVEPGVINQHLSDRVAPLGLVFSPDPASKAISTVGGNIATNAGGLLCAKYGVTREAVLGLVVVLADGSLLRTGRRSVKGVTGYDLTALFTGSEGTLGIIVEATVRLRPIAAGEVVTVGAFFTDVVSAAAASAAVTAARIRPAVMELMDAAALTAIDAYLETTLSRRGASYLLVQTDGGGAHEEAASIVELLTTAGGEVELARDRAQGDRLLQTRRAFHAALEAQGTVLIEDVCVPRSRLADMFAAIEQIAERYSLSIPTVAHAGDGNLHPNFVLPERAGEAEAARPGADSWVPDVVWRAANELFEAALALGGTLTGEHGIGVLKRRWLEREIGSESLVLQKGIKAVFDPTSIMNPGKVF
ncbi:FAD-binding oxidoreductase [Agreia sp. COWG]|uniref:FAD-binding oxidoreductase n=1 Tax=Agreia sp. COWG TaxID=2773266 RepID=UPI001925E054|nr:FAD-linked oxidase C-terminal domain-containing protein [Agreia sp. COWG]